MTPGYENDIWILEDKVRKLEARQRLLEAEVRELRALLTPLDPGSLPVSGNESRKP